MQLTSELDAPPLGAVLAAVREVLTDLLDVPGAVFACAADCAGGVVADTGATPGLAPVVETALRWGPGAEQSEDGWGDAVHTTGDHHLLVRRFDVTSRPLLVYLVVDRHRSDLDDAREALGGNRFRSRLTAAGTASTPARRSVWFGVSERASDAPPVASHRTGPALVTDGTADSWLLVAGLLADRSADPQLAGDQDQDVTAA